MFDDELFSKLVLERNLINQLALDRALDIQKNLSLYETVSLESMIPTNALLTLASELFEVPSVQFHDLTIEAEVIKLVPSSMAFRNRLIPLQKENDILVLGMLNPTDALAMDEISTRTGILIQPKVVDPKELNLALETYYGGHEDLQLFDDDFFNGIDSPEVESMVDDVVSEMGWDEMFDNGKDLPENEAQNMRDRPATGILDIDSHEIEIEDDASLLEGLGDPITADESYYDLEEWEIDSAIEHPNIGNEASLILSKDVDEFFTSGKKGEIAQIASEVSDVSEFSEIRDVQLTSEIPSQAGILKRARRASEVSKHSPSSFSEENDHATREITPNLLDAMFESQTEHEKKQPFLEENTAVHPDEIDRLAQLMMGIRDQKKERKSETQPQSILGLAQAVDLDIPPEISEGKLIEIMFRLLLAQGLIDRTTMIQLFEKEKR